MNKYLYSLRQELRYLNTTLVKYEVPEEDRQLLNAFIDIYDFYTWSCHLEEYANYNEALYLLLYLLYISDNPNIIKIKREYLFDEYEVHSYNYNQTNKQLRKKYTNLNVLIKVINGLYVELYDNTIHYNPSAISRSKCSRDVSLLNIIALFSEEITNLITEDLLDNIDDLNIDYEQLKNDILNMLNNKYKNVKEKQLEDIIKNKLITAQKDQIDLCNTNLENLQRSYSQALELRKQAYFKIQCLENTSININNKLSYLREKEIIVDYDIIINATYQNTILLNIAWYPLPIAYYEKEILEKSIENILPPGDLDALDLAKKLNNDELIMYNFPIKTSITIDEKIDFKTNSLLFNGPSELINKHAMCNSGKGCRGSFALPFQEASNEINLNKYIALVMQFYQSISVGDPYGNESIRNLIIADKEGNIIKGNNHYFLRNKRINNISQIKQLAKEVKL